MITLGARLEACASLVRKGKVPADVGTDHAYLPIWLIQNGIAEKAYASDINEEPIKTAKNNIERYGLSGKIIAFTADGLQSTPYDDVDDIIIAGMGGDNIAEILSSADWLKNYRYRLILQPMSRASKLREFLYKNGFVIIYEKAVCEAGRVYTVICSEYSDQPTEYNEFDIFAGKLDCKDKYATLLLKKQAGILRSIAEGYGAKGNLSEKKRMSDLADDIDQYAMGGKQGDKRKERL